MEANENTSNGHILPDNSESFLDLEPLEDLDDAEFGLPPIEQPPSLEDILAADENEEFDEFFDEESDGHVRFFSRAHRLPELEIRPLAVAPFGRPGSP